MLKLREMVFVGAGFLAVHPCHAATSEETLLTTFTLLVGRTDAAASDKGTVTLLPWTVVVPGEAAERAAGEVNHLISQLKSTYGLRQLRVAEVQSLSMTVDKDEGVPSPAPGLTIRASLLAFDVSKAVYKVVLAERDKIIAEPRVTVLRGGRGIVGGQDGAAAPYLFVVIEPESTDARGKGAPQIKSGRLIHKVEPVYPADAAAAGVQGIVILECSVGVDGAVRDVKVIKELSPTLNDAAVEAVRQWRYEAARDASGQAVEVQLTITVAFMLHDDAGK